MRRKIWQFAIAFGSALCITGCGDMENRSEATEAVIEETTQEETTEEPTTEEPTTPDPSYELWEEVTYADVDYGAVEAVYESKYDEIENKQLEIEQEMEHPALYITTEDGRTKKDKEYSPVIVDLVNCDEEYELNGVHSEIKVRGNSSAQSSPYPYRLKFEEKVNLLGLNDGQEYRSWVLLKPYWTFCPNFLALNIANTLFDGDYYVSDCEYVNLYMNGKYIGLYLLCEQNQVNEGRVEVAEPEYGNTDTRVGYFIEMDNNEGEDHPYFDVYYGERSFTDMEGTTEEIQKDHISIISDICCDAQMNFIEKYYNGVFEIAWAAIEEDKAMTFDEDYNVIPAEDISTEEAVRAVLDIQSVINMLTLEELVQNYVVGAGSFYFCVDFSEGAKYDRLTMTCPWDFNWAYEKDANKNYYASTWQPTNDGYDRSNIWFMLLMKADWFRKEFYSNWDQVVESGKLDATLDAVLEHVELYRNDLGDDNWMIDQSYNIVDFVKNRMKFLSKESKKFFEE